ncbi:outer membrane beta-barrel protein [Vibrio sp. ZSDE26]|uniref:Outer membrane beta-barrel protein n=1 Tax=Vibrio amylolyticus TaxID=2847292 RepID=A0A9X2BFH9_9VIBR|nr:outer membrane beta-barrel protein [Vibrio amylolyticus]MCK6261769.1 outer membrane beta-barrel protein [Vibrio amylolyticus]
MKKTLLALALIGASTTAMADSFIYGGASVGASSLGSEDATSYNIHAGTGILPFIGLEAGYTDHGKFEFAAGDVKASSVYFAVKPSINFGPLQVYAKGGLHSWDMTGNGSEFSNDDDYDLMYGVGADYAVFGPISFGANYMNYVVGDEDIGTFSLTASFNFL